MQISWQSEWHKFEKRLLVTAVVMCVYCQVGLLNESISAC